MLKPEGVFVSYDPIAYNPIINVYRRIATRVRTSDEKPLTVRDLNRVKYYFSEVRYTAFWLTTLLIFVKFYFIDRIDPNQERYWKRIVTEHKNLEHIFRPLKKIDNTLLMLFPFLKWYCWNLVIISKK